MKAAKGRNQTFNFLYVMAIIMVIDDHCSTRIGFLSSIFPYNSFYMPLFVFASGYFFHIGGVFTVLKHKTKKMLLPYLLWNVAAMALAWVLDRVTGVNWVKMPTLRTVGYMLFNQSPTSLNGAAWFVLMLFWTSVSYNLLRNVLKPGKRNDLLLTLVLMAAGFAAVQLCVQGYSEKNGLWLFILKITFYIQFYHYGYMFRCYAERWIQRRKRLAVCGACVGVNVVLWLVFGDKINFYSTAQMASFSVWYLPLVTSVTGILFYYEVMDFLAGRIGRNRVTDFISRNTFTIMETHLLFLNIPNFYAYFQALGGNETFADFPVERFINSAWVRYSGNTRMIGFFCGVLGSLAVAFALEKIRLAIANRKNRSVLV